MSDSKPIGDLLDSLGVTATIEDGVLVEGAIVLLKTVGEDGVEMTISWSDGISFLERTGMLRYAEDMTRTGGWEREDCG